MSTRKAIREYRISQWFPIIKACHDSGMSVRAWCKQNDVIENELSRLTAEKRLNK